MDIDASIYDAQRQRHAFMRDSYQGGDCYRLPSCTTLGTANLYNFLPLTDANGQLSVKPNSLGSYGSYLVAFAGETIEEFTKRATLATYVNFIAPIIDSYSDSALDNVTRDLTAIEGRMSSLNGRGRKWKEFVKETGRWTAVYGYGAVVIEKPAVNAAANQAEQEASGLSMRAIFVHPSAWAWVDVSDDGSIQEFAFVDTPYLAKSAVGNQQLVVLWSYTLTGWKKIEAVINTSQGYFANRSAFSQGRVVAEGPLAIPGKIPVFFTYFKEDTTSRWPLGTSLVADAVDAAREVYNILSNIGDIHRKTAFPFLAIPQKSVDGSLNPETTAIIGPDKALGYPSETGAPGWIQPSADQTSELRTHAMFIIAMAYRLCGIEISAEMMQGMNNDASGLALQVKSRSFESRCKAYASNMEAFENDALGYIAKVLGAEPVKITYPKRFVLPDAAEDLARALLLFAQVTPANLGPTGAIECLRQAIGSALSISDDMLNTVMDEIRVLTGKGALVNPNQVSVTMPQGPDSKSLAGGIGA